MNCRLDNVTVTSKDGKQSILEQVKFNLIIQKNFSIGNNISEH